MYICNYAVKLESYEAAQVPNTGYLIMSAYPGSRKMTAAHYSGNNGTIADKFTVENTAEWPMILLVVLSSVLFLASLWLMIFMALRHRPIRQHSTLMDPLAASLTDEV